MCTPISLGKKTKLPGNLSWLALAGMMLWVGDVYWEGGFSTMGDASTLGQGTAWGEPQEGRLPASLPAGPWLGASTESCLCPHQVVQMQCNMDWQEERRQWHVRMAQGSTCSCRPEERQARHPRERKLGLFNSLPLPYI